MVAKKESALTNTSKGQINLSDEQKHELVNQKAQSLNIVLFEDDVKVISTQIKESYTNRQSLTAAITKAINWFLAEMNKREAEEVEKNRNELNNMMNSHNEKMTRELQNIGEFVKQDSEQWQNAAKHALNLFKIPEK